MASVLSCARQFLSCMRPYIAHNVSIKPRDEKSERIGSYFQ